MIPNDNKVVWCFVNCCFFNFFFFLTVNFCLKKYNYCKFDEKKTLGMIFLCPAMASPICPISRIAILSNSLFMNYQLYTFIVKMQNACNLTGWNSLDISDVFNCYNASINVMWNAWKLSEICKKFEFILTYNKVMRNKES